MVLFQYFGHKTHRKVAGDIGKSKGIKRERERGGNGVCRWILWKWHTSDGTHLECHHGRDAAAHRVFVYLCVCIFVCDCDGVMEWECPFIERACSCHAAPP